jgi:hypothetical protein
VSHFEVFFIILNHDKNTKPVLTAHRILAQDINLKADKSRAADLVRPSAFLASDTSAFSIADKLVML